jgi:uncharacterized protein
MDLTGRTFIAAPRTAVWTALNDPAVLAQCIEGCERLERQPDGRLEGAVQAKVGPVKALFQGVVTLSDIVDNQSYVITGEGKGGVAGFAKGRAEVTLEDSEGGTTLAYVVKATVGGKLAQLGARLIDATAKAYADNFFARFKTYLETPAPEASETPDLEPVGADSAAAPAAAGVAPWIWASALAVLLVILLWAIVG